MVDTGGPISLPEKVRTKLVDETLVILIDEKPIGKFIPEGPYDIGTLKEVFFQAHRAFIDLKGAQDDAKIYKQRLEALKPPKMVTMTEACKVAGVSYTTMKGWITRGAVHARKVGRTWQIDLNTVHVRRKDRVVR